ncbi:TPA: hypothetical protein QDA93_005441 [Burkholderia vietnamiensis]|nr:hypothetical protein [Burkholderia vietnamiensis]
MEPLVASMVVDATPGVGSAAGRPGGRAAGRPGERRERAIGRSPWGRHHIVRQTGDASVAACRFAAAATAFA